MSQGLKVAARELGVAVTHSWAVDIDADATATFKQNFPAAKVLTRDIRRLDLSDLSEVDGMAFGFPCNDFSLVGQQRGTRGDFGPLYSYCVSAVERFQPKWFVAENVGGIRSANSGVAFEEILGSFVGLGYRLTPHLFKFENYGVPQRRHRVLIVGIRSDLGMRFKVPATIPGFRSAQQALEEPPIASDAPNHELTRQAPHVVARLEALGPGENAFSESLPVEHRLNIKGATISQIYRRLSPGVPAYTVTGSGGGGTHVYHWSEPRALTNRERARLQSFEDDYEFIGSKESVRRQIGMAVPPVGAAAVYKALLMTMRAEPYDFVEPSLGAKYSSLIEQLEICY